MVLAGRLPERSNLRSALHKKAEVFQSEGAPSSGIAMFPAEKMAMDMINATEKSSSHILVADDEPLIQRFVSQVLSGDGYNVTSVSSGDEAMKLMERNRFDLIITDIVMPGAHNGLDVLSAARKGDTEYKVIVITGFHTVTSRQVV